MKKFLLTLFGITMISSLLAQEPHGGGTLKAIVNGTSVILKDDTTTRNCAATYQMQVDVTVDNHNTGTITWLQYDIGWQAGCDCHFNYSVSLDSLQKGHYYANVFFTEVHGPDPGPGIPYDTVYEGTVQFDIVDSTAQHFVKTDSTASPCFTVYTDEFNLPFLSTSIGPCFPNPFQSVTKIPVNHFSEGDFIEVFNQFGLLIPAEVTRFDNYYTCNLSKFESGIYFYKLHSTKEISRVFRMVLIK
jgi:hypothetical protein